MTLLKKCPACKKYSLSVNCKNCKTETQDAHYKYKHLKDAPTGSSEDFWKKYKK